jgi:hypothetical protein
MFGNNHLPPISFAADSLQILNKQIAAMRPSASQMNGKVKLRLSDNLGPYVSRGGPDGARCRWQEDGVLMWGLGERQT